MSSLSSSDLTEKQLSVSHVSKLSSLHVDTPLVAYVENTPNPLKDYPYPQTPTQPTNQTNRLPPILTVTVGINEYEDDEFTNLIGAVADADAFENYLKSHLNVPEQNILSLRNEKATWSEIISSFHWLRDHKAYKKCEAAIVVYFAGHGDQAEDSEDRPTPTGTVEMLCPCDMGTCAKENVHGQISRDVVPGISHHLMSALLNEIADKKGNNITVILDCCNAAGMVRSTKRDNDRSEDSEMSPSNNTKVRAVPSKDLVSKHQSSFVVMASCGRDDRSREDPVMQRGLFTHRLLDVLEREDIDNLTYGSLMHKLTMPTCQTPHCEGDGIHWRLFNNRIPGADKSMILTKRNKKDKTILQAGSVQGVIESSRYAVHVTNLMATPMQPNPCLGYLVVERVEDTYSVLTLDKGDTTFDLPTLFYSKLDQLVGDSIYVYCLDRVWLESVFRPELRSKLSVVLVSNQQSCDLEITLLDGYAYFDQHRPCTRPYLHSRMRRKVPATNFKVIRNIVQASFHFYRNLTRCSPVQFDAVYMELHRLTEAPGKVFQPVGDNLITEEPAKIVIDEDAALGVTIHNESNIPLYPHLFYFDPDSLTIVAWYLPPIGAGTRGRKTKVDVPLLPQSTLEIGYGDCGGNPWSFFLPTDVEQDLGFFRLFLTTHPVSLASVRQENTPFDPSRAPSKLLKGPELKHSWSVQTVTLIQVPAEKAIQP